MIVALAILACAAVPWERSEWISVAGDRAAKETSVFRWSAANPKQVRRVRWVATGLGVFNLYLNGKLIGADFLKPGYTDNRKTKYAFAYDVTAEALAGCCATNDFGVEVTGGWWHDAIVGGRGRKPAFRGLIEYTYADGAREVKGTRASEWFGTTGGPLTRAGIWEGESFDARATNVARTPAGPFVPGGCERNDEFKGEVFPAIGAKVLLREDLSMTRGPFRLKAGETNVIDFGQNCAAVQFADWLSFERFNGDRTAYWDYLGGCYWLWDDWMMRTMGAAIGKDVAAYARMEAEARTYLRSRFVSADDGLLIPSLRTLQTATAFALKLGLIEGKADWATWPTM